MNIEAIVLAAGKSSRMTGFKQLLPFGNSTIIETIIENALSVTEKVVVVVGYYSNRIINLKNWNDRILFVKNPNPEFGMFSSAKVGVKETTSPRFFIVLGDQPQVSMKVYKQLLEVTNADVVSPRYNKTSAHPVLLSEAVRIRILQADEKDSSVTLRTILSEFEHKYIEVNDEWILWNINTDEQYREMLKRMDIES
ncbi:MAG: NTP transferase domain-containing protein [Candidatus Marinimicrobia bacterium]|nr:NTP transferase domain-containing protein [Candidatus Neomarinimicrobiota bacterium]